MELCKGTSQAGDEAKSKTWTVGCLGSWGLPLSSPRTPRRAPAEELLPDGPWKWMVRIAEQQEGRETEMEIVGGKENAVEGEVRETVNETQCPVTQVNGLGIIRSETNRVTGKMR